MASGGGGGGGSSWDDIKAAVLAIVNANDCKQFNYVDNNLNGYSDIGRLLFLFSREWDCSTDALAYLYSLLNQFDTDDLATYGVLYNQTGTDVTAGDNLIAIINCTYTGTVSFPMNAGKKYKSLLICGSTIGELSISGANKINIVKLVAATVIATFTLANESSVTILQIGTCGDNISSITNAVSYAANIQKVIAETPSSYKCTTSPPSKVCGDEVSTPAATLYAANTITVTWTPPTNSNAVRVLIRTQGDLNFVSSMTGMTTSTSSNQKCFMGLSPNTVYEFLIQNSCTTPINVFSKGVIVSVATDSGALP